MTIPMRHLALAALTLMGTAAPALAQDVPADANKALWCSSAFTLVEPQARSQGQTSAADNFLKYSKQLADISHASLIKAGFSEDQIKAQGTAYTDKVNKELTVGGAAEFSVVDCVQVVDPQAAALIKSGSAAPGGAAAPADGTAAPAAPAAGTAPAPADNGTTTPPATSK